jgi:hypothetical protein
MDSREDGANKIILFHVSLPSFPNLLKFKRLHLHAEDGFRKMEALILFI